MTGPGAEPSPAYGAATAVRRLAAGIPGSALVMQQLERERARWFVWLPVCVRLRHRGLFRPFVRTGRLDDARPAGNRARPRASVPRRKPHLRRGSRAPRHVAGLCRRQGAHRNRARARAPAGTPLRRCRSCGRADRATPDARRTAYAPRHLDQGAKPSNKTPTRVRIRAMRKTEGLRPGDIIRLRATLRPPALPAIPGGYDFSRWAWFQGLGATGFSLTPATIISQPPVSGAHSLAREAREHLERIRHTIGERIRAAVPGESGAIAVSLITAERGGITEKPTTPIETPVSSTSSRSPACTWRSWPASCSGSRASCSPRSVHRAALRHQEMGSGRGAYSARSAIC